MQIFSLPQFLMGNATKSSKKKKKRNVARVVVVTPEQGDTHTCIHTCIHTYIHAYKEWLWLHQSKVIHIHSYMHAYTHTFI